MSQCTDRHLGNLLHAYELGILPDEDQLKFESHLLECDYCFEKAGRLETAISLLKDTPEVRQVAEEIAGADTAKRKSLKSIFNWAFSQPVVRFAAAAALLIVVAVPVYLQYFGTRGPEQQIFLSPVRGSERAVVDLEVGGTVAIRFTMPQATDTSTCSVSIFDRRNDTLYYAPEFRNFDKNGRAVVELKTSLFSPGIYELEIADCAGAESGRQYYFIAQ